MNGIIQTLLFISMLSVGTLSQALPIFTPPGLSPGDTYQLAFVTRTSTWAIPADIRFYNAHVQAAADAAFAGTILDGVAWSAIGSTATVNARDNARIVGPVFNLAGELLAYDEADMWDGTLGHTISFDENGDSFFTSRIWTGSQSDGTADPRLPLGAEIEASRLGNNSYTSSRWLVWSGVRSDTNKHLYALSAVITAPAAPAPVPATLTLLALGLAGMGVSRRKSSKYI